MPSKVKLRPTVTKSNSNSSTVDDDTLEKRQSEIYQSIREAREKIAQEAEKEADKERQYWEEQGAVFYSSGRNRLRYYSSGRNRLRYFTVVGGTDYGTTVVG